MKRKHVEQAFQIGLVRDLQRILVPGVFMTHFPAQGGRDGAMRGLFLKAMGLKAGVPDLLFIHEGRAFWMELKAKGRKLSPAQTETMFALKRAGSHVELVRTLDEALNCLELWNIPTRLHVKQSEAA